MSDVDELRVKKIFYFCVPPSLAAASVPHFLFYFGPPSAGNKKISFKPCHWVASLSCVAMGLWGANAVVWLYHVSMSISWRNEEQENGKYVSEATPSWE